MRNFHIIVFSKCEFPENPIGESHALMRGVTDMRNVYDKPYVVCSCRF